MANKADPFRYLTNDCLVHVFSFLMGGRDSDTRLTLSEAVDLYHSLSYVSYNWKRRLDERRNGFVFCLPPLTLDAESMPDEYRWLLKNKQLARIGSIINLAIGTGNEPPSYIDFNPHDFAFQLLREHGPLVITIGLQNLATDIQHYVTSKQEEIAARCPHLKNILLDIQHYFNPSPILFSSIEGLKMNFDWGRTRTTYRPKYLDPYITSQNLTRLELSIPDGMLGTIETPFKSVLDIQSQSLRHLSARAVGVGAQFSLDCPRLEKFECLGLGPGCRTYLPDMYQKIQLSINIPDTCIAEIYLVESSSTETVHFRRLLDPDNHYILTNAMNPIALRR